MSSDQNEKITHTSFSALKSARIEAPPFRKSRILAQLEGRKKASREVLFWRLIAGVATCACIALVAFNSRSLFSSEGNESLYAMKPYVIHVDFGNEKLTGAMIAEVELPDGVKFFSKAHPEVSKLTSMRMDIPDVIEGRSRLPFVVTADRPGIAHLKIRIMDENNQLVRERVISVNFAEDKKSHVL